MFLLLAALLISTINIADEKSDLPENSITMAELKDHMYYLASDELGGRVVGSEGYRLATIYAQSQFRAAGIIPILKDENGYPTYFQRIPLESKSYSKDSRWIFTTANGEKKFAPGNNILTIQISHPGVIAEATEMVFVGYGISEAENNWDDLKDLDLTGKVAVLMMGAPTKDGKPLLPADVHKKYLSVPGAERKVAALAQRGITRCIFISDDEIKGMWTMLPRAMANSVVGFKGQQQHKKFSLLISVADEEVAAFIMEGQEYNPFNNPSDPMTGYKSFVLKNAKVKLDSKSELVAIETWNVVGLIPGTDPDLKDEFVVLGGHLDHVAPVNGEVCNGADDNASGSVGVIEAAEALAMQDNKRSILVCLWAAEEAGLLGSKYFVAHPPVNFDQIKVNVNLDMIARTDQINRETRAIHAIGTSKADPSFRTFIEDQNRSSVNWPLNFSDLEIGLRGSDHNSFMQKGIPVLFFFSGPHKDYHTPDDDPENLDWEKFLKVAKLACNITAALANTDTPLDNYRSSLADK